MIKEKSKKTLNIFQKSKKPNFERTELNDLWSGDEVPYALKSSLSFIYCYHLKTVNVFRRNGNEIAHESLCNYLKRNLNHQPRLSLSMIYDVCSAVKAYIRDIPNGLMVKKFVKKWHKISRLTNSETSRKKLRSLIQKLPQANKNLLFHFLVLASAIVEHQGENAMSSKSLSIVLLPSLFEKVVNIKDVKDLPYFVELLEMMILNAEYLMDPECFEVIQRNYIEIGKRLVILAPHDEEKSMSIFNSQDIKRSEFTSLDSGLNSTSFLDDKTSQSLSSSSQARVNYEENGNSMEDLLNESDCINTTSISDRSVEIRLHKSDSICSISSSISSNSNVNFILPKTRSEHQCAKSQLKSHVSCVGKHMHNIKDCRPCSVYDSSTFFQTKWDNPRPCKRDYTPVYDRSLTIEDSLNKMQEKKDTDEKVIEPKPCNVIQRKKPILKKSTCSAVQIEKRNNAKLHSSSSTITITSPNYSSTPHSSKQSDIHFTLSSNSSIDSYSSKTNNRYNTNVYKPKRMTNTTRIRYTVPIRPTDVEEQLCHCYHREASVEKSDDS